MGYSFSDGGSAADWRCYLCFADRIGYQPGGFQGGFGAVRRSAREARILVQPVALVAYGVAFALHMLSDWSAFAKAPGLGAFALTALLGSILGRLIGPRLPQRAIMISIAVCVALFRRAYHVE
ncbi:MAG: hypothetical protein WBA90_11015 [Albidovulum sp.]